MRQAMGQAALPPGDAERLEQQFPDAALTPSGLRMRIEQPGQGGKPPLKGQIISVHYRGRLLDGTVIEDSYARGEGPLNVIAGKGLFEGWDEALLQMTVGEKRTVVVPYWLGFGDKGNPRRGVPPRATLVFELELVGIR